ncbi:MAG: respiratory nitrate reductase subunit gamma [Candidatus Dormibacteraeota bacterium]|nr:respiratory nitrate reductase subunit gamma [Candidatus Dormibacteraeota bacterium]
MTRGDLVLWVVLPYVSITIFVVGHIWRYRHDQFGWTSRSTQLLEDRLLRWGNPLFHYGALAAIGGHVLGILIPAGLTERIGISDNVYHFISVSAGTVAWAAVIVGLLILAYRRVMSPRVRATTTRTDVLTFGLLFIVIALGIWETLGVNLIQGGYEYRATVAIWFRGIFTFDPHTELMTSAPLVYQLHAISAWLLFAVWPFSRLVHAWSIPITFLGRAQILYRSAVPAGRSRGSG